ncbi:cardiolipin synthase [Arenibacter sp. GZD96]|uniref:cardiolipin synthase n=1 Tax=Aurantibrevibacter litoralis TaxID=3106030 RepID=UPI002AFFE2DD|nr:cardiolipin synthase [Arenibacter sp. GZD-96]MEA1785196.1 cardiolipin synthase [Arenibacter sp. GZD-96]
MYTALIVLYSLLALSLVVGLLLHGVRPSKTLAWLLAIFTIPVGGILLYFLLGRNRRIHKLHTLKEHERIKGFLQDVKKRWYLEDANVTHLAHYQRLSYLIENNSGFSPTSQNSVQLLKNGQAAFNAIFRAIEQARNHIYVQYYIFEDGALAQRMFHLFETKIKEGVRVKMIYDGVGSYSLSKKYIARLKAIGVEIFPFLPFKWDRFLTNLNYRNHRKILAIDGRIAFTGGMNIADKYVSGDPVLGKWHDMHIQLTGMAAQQLEAIFTADLFIVSGDEGVFTQPNTVTHAGDSLVVQIAPGGPDDYFSTIGQAYFYMITNAKKYIYITNPYVIPGQELLEALQVAARSGVDVRLLISEKADSKLVSLTVRSYFEMLLKAGVKIYLFPDGFLHSKIIIMDDEVTSIGTANMDIRSFEQNYEVNAVMYDADFAKKLKTDFLLDCEKSKRITYAEFLKRSFWSKLKEGTAKIFSPIL